MYVLNTDGSITKYTGDSREPQTTSTPSDFLNEVIGDFKSGKNYSSNSHDVFDGTDNSSPLFGEILPDLNDLGSQSTSGIIGQSKQLYPYAFGDNMKAEPSQVALPFYKPYNSVFDLDQNLSGRTSDSEKNFELFADEAEMLYGVPMILNERDKFIGDLENVFSSLGDVLAAAIVSITSISVIQGLLQVAQDGPPDPFGLFGSIKMTESDRKGRFINYVKLDPIATPYFIADVVNPLIEGLVSLLRTTERLMNFPSRRASPGIQGIFFDLAENIVSFCLGYIYYLIPGFKLEQGLFDTNPGAIISNLISTIVSLIFVNKSRHNYNLLIRKIVKNNYFRRNIQFKAKTITNSDGSTYAYNNQFWYDLSGFFYRFIGERTAVGQKVIAILKNTERNKKNKPFSVQKMKELPFEEKDGNGVSLPLPLPIGSSILGGGNENENSKPNTNHFNKSIYSLTSLIQNKSSNANSYLKYHEKLIEQNKAIYQKKEKRLSKEHVKELEAIINSDYMPFSIQDLRTNELFKFHAFVESYGDTFTVQWEDAGMGFGRMDSIKTYKGTSRNISVDFWLISMSPDDFDYMWWLINRLIALIYPQWSAAKPANFENQQRSGILNSKGEFAGIPFAQPFTQIPTGSPLVRLRLGDIFTSNYSKKGLARIFGFDLTEKNIKDFKYSTNGFNNIPITSTNSTQYDNIKLLGYQIFSQSDYADYANNKTSWGIFSNLDQQDFIDVGTNKDINMNSSWKEELQKIQKLVSGNYSDFYYDIANDPINLDDINSPKSAKNEDKNVSQPKKNKAYKKLIYVPINIIEDGEQKVMILLYSVEITQGDQGPRNFVQLIDQIAADITNALKAGVLTEAEKDYQKLKQNNLNLDAFLSADGQVQLDADQINSKILEKSKNIVNNPIVKSFESTMGEGLAGTIQTFTINFDQNIPWEINSGSRAPIAVKISLGLSVIHDILPGLDDKGIMRAPTYRVGKLNNDFFGNSVYQEIPNNIVYSNEFNNTSPVLPSNTPKPQKQSNDPKSFEEFEKDIQKV
jgi:hypothetical protein